MQKRGVVTCTLGTINHCGGVGHRFFTYFFFLGDEALAFLFPQQHGTCFFPQQQDTCFFFPFSIHHLLLFLTHTKYGVVAEGGKNRNKGANHLSLWGLSHRYFQQGTCFFSSAIGHLFIFSSEVGVLPFFLSVSNTSFFFSH